LNDLVILAALLRAPAYGYALKKTAGLIYGNRAMHPNIVYPLLKKFVQNGLVERSSIPGERGQTRKQYRITAAGRDYLLGQLSTFTEQDASDDGAFLFRVAFFDALPKQRRKEILDARRLFLNSRAEELASLSREMNGKSFGVVALDRVRALVEHELQWVRTLEKRIESEKGDVTCKACTYTAGYSAPVLSFLEQRTAKTHAGFFLPELKPGFRVLDAGCGPGTITLGLARGVAPGEVIGIDIEDSQFASAREQARQEGLNITFQKASIYQLPFDDGSFDAVFSHDVLQYVGDPPAALAELHRVLKPGGVIGIRSGDMGGTLIDAESEGPASGLASYLSIRKEGEGDLYIGRKLPRLLRKAGFQVERVTASYEVMSDLLRKIGPALAAQFLKPDHCSIEDKPDDSLFVALAWCEVIGRA
jgi:SAM-dependent methyltransferase/DNA-binding PadR family transcriptional regulator